MTWVLILWIRSIAVVQEAKVKDNSLANKKYLSLISLHRLYLASTFVMFFYDGNTSEYI